MGQFQAKPGTVAFFDTCANAKGIGRVTGTRGKNKNKHNVGELPLGSFTGDQLIKAQLVSNGIFKATALVPGSNIGTIELYGEKDFATKPYVITVLPNMANKCIQLPALNVKSIKVFPGPRYPPMPISTTDPGPRPEVQNVAITATSIATGTSTVTMLRPEQTQEERALTGQEEAIVQLIPQIRPPSMQPLEKQPIPVPLQLPSEAGRMPGSNTLETVSNGASQSGPVFVQSQPQPLVNQVPAPVPSEAVSVASRASPNGATQGGRMQAPVQVPLQVPIPSEAVSVASRASPNGATQGGRMQVPVQVNKTEPFTTRQPKTGTIIVAIAVIAILGYLIYTNRSYIRHQIKSLT